MTLLCYIYQNNSNLVNQIVCIAFGSIFNTLCVNDNGFFHRLMKISNILNNIKYLWQIFSSILHYVHSKFRKFSYNRVLYHSACKIPKKRRFHFRGKWNLETHRLDIYLFCIKLFNNTSICLYTHLWESRATKNNRLLCNILRLLLPGNVQRFLNAVLHFHLPLY